MTFIYDIILNFNSEFYEFYEWEKNDYITHIRKIPIYKVDTKIIDDVLNKKIIVDSKFLCEILNKTEIFENKKIKTLKYACLLTDSYRVIAILLNDDYNIIKVSDLLLDEAYDTINISKRLKIETIAYNIIGDRKNNVFLTRNEVKIKKYIFTELKNAYKNKDIDKLKYLYFEYFNNYLSDINKIYVELVNSLNKEITPLHLKLYELLKLAHQGQLSNLTKN